MIKNNILILLLLMPLALACCSSQKNPLADTPAVENPSAKGGGVYSAFLPGETITYAIKSFGVKAGEATLTFKGIQESGGKQVYVIDFTVRAVKFFDEEKIYADMETFYPLKVERDLNIAGKKEKITETYDQKKGLIKISKISNNKETSQVIEKQGPIDNIYCFIYRYRKSGKFKIGDSFSIKLPTKDVTIQLLKETPLKAAGKNFNTYYMQSDPAKYKVWFDVSRKKIPLRINGAVGLSDTAMIMSEYAETHK